MKDSIPLHETKTNLRVDEEISMEKKLNVESNNEQIKIEEKELEKLVQNATMYYDQKDV